MFTNLLWGTTVFSDPWMTQHASGGWGADAWLTHHQLASWRSSGTRTVWVGLLFSLFQMRWTWSPKLHVLVTVGIVGFRILGLSPVSEAQRYGVSSGQPRRRPTLMDQSKGSGTQDTQGWSSVPILFRASSAYCSCMELDTWQFCGQYLHDMYVNLKHPNLQNSSGQRQNLRYCSKSRKNTVFDWTPPYLTHAEPVH